jgi:lysophospholipase L1-like esterase
MTATTPRSSRRALLRAAAALLAAGALAACSSTESQRTLDDVEPQGVAAGDDDVEPRTIAMVGDSITFMATDPLREGLSSLGLDVVTIDAQVGRRMTVGTELLYPGVDVVGYVTAADDPDVWVVALGTNDVGQYGDPAQYAEQVTTVLDAIPDGVPVVWVDTWHRERLDDAVLLNDVIRDVVGRRDRTLVVDWFQYGDDDGVITDDGVHPTDAGLDVFGLVVTEGVQRLLATA